MTPDFPPAAASRSRRTVLLLVFALTVITYLDRLCISAAMPTIAEEFHLTAAQKGWIFSAFTFAYAAFEIPSGWLGDRFGARLALTRIVLWWSAFTMLTGAAMGFWSLLGLRFLFGAGEAGAFPNIARAVSVWFPRREQGRAMSVSFIGLAIGSALTAPLVFTLLEYQTWRWIFIEFGLIGLLWCAIWHRWFRDRPEDHPGVNADELEQIQLSGAGGAGGAGGDLAPHSPSASWTKMFASSNMIFICLMYFAYGYGLYFYITWLPTYMIEALGFDRSAAKWMSALPWALSVPGFWLGGWLTDRIARATGNLKLARCGIGAAGYGASALVLLFVPRLQDPTLAAVAVAVAFCLQTTTISAAWSVCLDVGRRYAGVVTGYMNTVGNLGGAISPLVVGYAVKESGSWALPFYVMAAVLALGVVMWLSVDPRRAIFAE
ncbi:MAG: MFS transporter [Blastocatellia bacterium]